MSETIAATGPGVVQVPWTRLPTQPATRYLRVRLAVIDGEVRWEIPRTLLRVVPLGVRRVAVPVAQVRDLRVRRFVVRWSSLVVGLAVAVLGPVAGLGWWSVPFVVFGAWVALASLTQDIELVSAAGVKVHACVCFAHRFDAEMYVDAVRAVSP